MPDMEFQAEQPILPSDEPQAASLDEASDM